MLQEFQFTFHTIFSSQDCYWRKLNLTFSGCKLLLKFFHRIFSTYLPLMENVCAKIKKFWKRKTFCCFVQHKPSKTIPYDVEDLRSAVHTLFKFYSSPYDCVIVHCIFFCFNVVFLLLSWIFFFSWFLNRKHMMRKRKYYLHDPTFFFFYIILSLFFSFESRWIFPVFGFLPSRLRCNVQEKREENIVFFKIFRHLHKRQRTKRLW